MSGTTDRERQVVDDLARRYQSEGYSVEREVLVGEHPADLVATRGNETVLVEVRLSSPASEGAPLEALAAVAQEKGWRFVIAIVGPRDIEEVEVPSVSSVMEKIREAETLQSAPTAFALLAWSVLEAAARIALARSGTTMRIATPRGLLQQLASRGLITTGEEREIAKLAEVRNRAAHGDWQSRGPQPDFRTLLDLAQRLLSESGQVSAAH